MFRNHVRFMGDHWPLAILKVKSGAEVGTSELDDKWCSKAEVALQGVTSRNSHITLLTNLGQFRVPSHLLHPITPYQVLSMLSHVLLTSVYLDPSLSSCFTFLSSPKPLLSHY